MDLNELYKILKQQLDVYNTYLEAARRKFEAISQENIPVLNEILSEEQVYYMQFRGLEQKREKLLNEAGSGQKTLRQLIEDMENGEEKDRFSIMHRELTKVLAQIKEQHESCKTITSVKLHNIETIMESMEQDTSSRIYDTDGSKDGGEFNSLSKKF